MKGYKFIIPPDEYRPVPGMPGYTVSGCAAFVVAESKEQALVILARVLHDGGNPPWCHTADITEVPLDVPSVGLLVQI